MLKLVGGGLVVLSGIGSGLLVCGHRKRQRQTAEQFTLGLRRIVRTLEQAAADTETLLFAGKRGCSGSAAHFFESMAQEVAQDQPLTQGWREAMEALDLSPVCAELVRQAGGLLGQYEAEAQCEGLSALVTALEEETKRAREEEGQSSRLCVALGCCGAVFLLVLLL